MQSPTLSIVCAQYVCEPNTQVSARPKQGERLNCREKKSRKPALSKMRGPERKRCRDNGFPEWMVERAQGIKVKLDLSRIYVFCVDQKFGPLVRKSQMQGLRILHALANSWSRQHVLEHAYGLSTLLSNAWQIDSVAAAGGGNLWACHCLVMSWPRCENRAKECSSVLLTTIKLSDSQLLKVVQGYFNLLKFLDIMSAPWPLLDQLQSLV